METLVRTANTRQDGLEFDEETKQLVWNKGKAVSDSNPAFIRLEACGMWMAWSDYGKRSSRFGWEIDHIKPVAAGGTDELANLRPLNWQNNASKADRF